MNRISIFARLAISALIFVVGLCSAQRSAAVTIDWIYDLPGAPGPVVSGITGSSMLAASRWTTRFSDPVALHFKIASVDMGPAGPLGFFEIDPVTSAFSYTSVTGALDGDKTSSADFLAVSSLQIGSTVAMLTQDTTTAPTARAFYGPASPKTFNSTLRLTRANQKALGLLAPVDGAPGADGTIFVNSALFPAMDFDPGDGITPMKFDMAAILTHELAHGLGFISGVDHIDFASSDGAGHSGPDFPHDYSDETIFTPLDLYRYSDDSTSFIIQPPIGTTLDWAAGAKLGDNPYFSVDAGATKLALFSTGKEFGDGFQAQHWKNETFFIGPVIGLMDPAIGTGVMGIVTPMDTMALDVVGWTIVPEPSTFAMAGMGLAAAVAITLQRRRAARMR